jgi:hypothetical protein
MRSLGVFCKLKYKNLNLKVYIIIKIFNSSSVLILLATLRVDYIPPRSNPLGVRFPFLFCIFKIKNTRSSFLREGGATLGPCLFYL